MTTNNHLNYFTEIDPKTREDLLKITDELLRVEHLDFDNRTYLAKTLFNLGKYDESIRQLEKILSSNGHDRNTLAYIGINHFYRKDYESALKYFRKALEEDITECILTYMMLCYEFLDDFQNAVRIAEKLLKIDPKNSQVINRIIDYHFELRNYDECLYYINRIRYKDHFKKAVILYESRRYEECISEASKIRTSESYRLAGKAHQKLGNISKAAKYLYKSFEKDFNTDTLFEISDIYFEADDPKKAVFYLKKVLIHDEENVEAYSRIAKAYLETGEWNDAVEYAEMALAITKKVPEAYITMAEAYVQLDRGNCENEKIIIEEGIRENPESSELWVKKGDIEFENPIEFARAYEKAISLNPTDSKPYLRYINTLLMMDDVEKAKIYYNRLLVVNPLFEKSFKELEDFWSW